MACPSRFASFSSLSFLSQASLADLHHSGVIQELRDLIQKGVDSAVERLQL